jgi:PIN like domain
LTANAAPPERPTLFIDRCAWSRTLGRALEAALIPFAEHGQLFPPACPDEVWLEGVAGKGWLVVTRDQQIRYKVNEQAAAMRAGLHLFVFTRGALPAAQTAELLVAAYPAMVRLAAADAAPAFYSIQLGGHVARLRVPDVSR